MECQEVTHILSSVVSCAFFFFLERIPIADELKAPQTQISFTTVEFSTACSQDQPAAPVSPAAS